MTAPKSAAYIAELVGMWNTRKYTVTLLAHHFGATPASIIGLIARARKKGLVTISKIGVPGGSGRKYKRAEARKTARPEKSSGGVEGHTDRQASGLNIPQGCRAEGAATLRPRRPEMADPVKQQPAVEPGPLDTRQNATRPDAAEIVPQLMGSSVNRPIGARVSGSEAEEACRSAMEGSEDGARRCVSAEGGNPSPIFGQFTLDQAQTHRGCRWQTQAPPERLFCGQPIAAGWLDFCADHKRRAIGRHVPHPNTGRREPDSARILEA